MSFRRSVKTRLCGLSLPRRGRSLICAFHSVGSDSPASIPAETFLDQMQALRRCFKVVPLPDLIARTAQGETGMAAVTFDDGYRDNYERVFPAMTRLSLPFSIFVTSGFIERTQWAWSSEYSMLPAMTWDQIRELGRHGVHVGCHTHEHRRWSSQPTDDLRIDLNTSKRMIEDNLGSAIDSFAYPYGQPHDYDWRAQKLLPECGFSMACTTLNTTFKRCADRLQIPRLSINAEDSMTDFQMHLSGKRDLLAAAQSLQSYVHRGMYRVRGMVPEH
jgi:peptidoglycan/xylan/chitin deacetylase (PgdA/CDA1 family)